MHYSQLEWAPNYREHSWSGREDSPEKRFVKSREKSLRAPDAVTQPVSHERAPADELTPLELN